MTQKTQMKTDHIPAALIAPCGMNCILCYAYVRDKKSCPGCRGSDDSKSISCLACRIKNCEKIAGGNIKYCYECDSFPCARLKQLDKRYRTKYCMSMIENLNTIQNLGIRRFIENEKKRWACPKCGRLLSVHKSECIYCHHAWRLKWIAQPGVVADLSRLHEPYPVKSRRRG
jgi:hypothetical protein